MSHGLAIPKLPLSIFVADTPNLDAFSRLRVSDPQTLFDAQLQYNLEPLKLEGGATSDGVAPAHSASTRMALLKVAAGATGGTSFLQSYSYIPYQPGKSQFIALTGVMQAGVAGAIKRFGYGDASNGIFYEQDGTNGIRFNRRTSTSGGVADNTVTQANWNLDRLDGTGSSGITLDVTKCFILIIDLQFLGMGRVRVGFDLDGIIVYAHEFLNANSLTVPYMQTASLPIMIEIVAAAGLAGDATSNFKCAQVASEGGFFETTGRDFSVEGSVAAASGARTHILSLRPLTTFNGITNRALVRIESLELLGGLNPVYWEMCAGCTFTVAPTWANASATYSAMEFGINGTLNTVGVVIASGYIGSGSGGGRSIHSAELQTLYPVTLNRAGAVRDFGTLSMILTGIGGASASRAAFNWSEIR